MPGETYAPFLDETALWTILEQEARPEPARIAAILEKAAEGNGVSLEESAALLAPMPETLLERLYDAALRLKERVYGKRMVLFAPLYVSNLCANSCAYCAFSSTNPDLHRSSLTEDAIREEVGRIQAMGHKRLIAVYGEHPSWDAEAIARSLEVMYSVKTPPNGEIRRINVNCAPLDVRGFAVLKQAGIGTYQCFQETYHRETYARVHPGGPKRDYDWRLFAMHRAQEGGADDVGLGVLFGLFDHRFEVLALLRHAHELESRFGAGPHTISFPRIEPAQNAEMSRNPPHAVSDPVFKRIIAVIRLALPYTGMIITTREQPAIKQELLRLGISQLSAASRTSPGGYGEPTANRPRAQQFQVGDERGLDEVIEELQDQGYVPSFCTSCYRRGRTGEQFMGLARTAFIRTYCEPNALLTYHEYLCDYALPQAFDAGQTWIRQRVAALPEAEQAPLLDKLRRITDGERDLCV